MRWDELLQIVETGNDDVECFQWVCQLRTYWDKSIEDCRIRICDASFPYGYEYLGNGPRLVITPLTDRIYITATQACWLCLGTAPAGPAGTGEHYSVQFFLWLVPFVTFFPAILYKPIISFSMLR